MSCSGGKHFCGFGRPSGSRQRVRPRRDRATQRNSRTRCFSPRKKVTSVAVQKNRTRTPALRKKTYHTPPAPPAPQLFTAAHELDYFFSACSGIGGLIDSVRQSRSFFAFSASDSFWRFSRKSWIVRHPTVNIAPWTPFVRIRVFRPRPKSPT